MGAAAIMAKKRPGKAKPPEWAHIQVRVSREFREWLQDYASSRLLSMSDTVVQDLIEGAARRGFARPPKR